MPHRVKGQLGDARIDQQLAWQQHQQRNYQGHPLPALPVLPDRRRTPGDPAQAEDFRTPQLAGNPEDSQDNREELLRMRRLPDQEDNDQAAGATENAADCCEWRRKDKSVGKERETQTERKTDHRVYSAWAVCRFFCNSK